MAWPTVTDDTGDKVSGTVFNKALTDAIKTYIDGLCVSGTNPTVTPEDIIDEVVAARGSKTSLDARLDVALNEDGTPKAVAGQATETQVGRQVNGQDLARNRYMALWSDGATVAPDFYVLAGAGAAIQQCGIGLADTTQVGVGRFTARVISGAGAAAELQQLIIASTELDDFTALRGRKVNFMVRGQAPSANSFRLIVTDGVNTTTSSYNTTGAAEDLSVQHTIANTATYLQVSVEVALGTVTVYLGGYSVVFGDVLPTRWEAAAPLEPFRVEPGVRRQVAKNLSNIASINGENGFTWSMPANTLNDFGAGILVEAAGAFAATAGNKSIRLYVGTNYLTVIPIAAHNFAGNKWHVWGRLVRTSSTAVVFDGIATYDAADGAAPTIIHWASALASGATDLTTAQDVSVNQVTGVISDSTIARVFFEVLS